MQLPSASKNAITAYSLTALGSAMNTECTGNVMHEVDFLYYMPDPP